MPHPTPFFACWLPQLAPLGRRCQSALRPLRQATLSQIEQCFANALPGALLAQNEAKDHSRERIFTLARTFWGWIWQVLQAHTSCREVVRQVQALFALHEAGEVDQATGAYCQARRKLPHTALLGLFQASASSAQKAAGKLLGKQALLGGRSIQVIDCSGARLCDTAENRAAFPPSKSLAAGAGFPLHAYRRALLPLQWRASGPSHRLAFKE